MKRTIATLAATLVAAAIISPATASAAATKSGCSYYIRGNSVHATCTNDSNHTMTANLYVDCQPNWHNPHVRKPVGPHQTVGLSTICGGWSHIVGASAYLS